MHWAKSHTTLWGPHQHSSQSVCPSLDEQSILCADCMISQRSSCWWVWSHWSETSHSQISHPHAGSPWTFDLFDPLTHSISGPRFVGITTHDVCFTGVDSPRVLQKNCFFQFSFKAFLSDLFTSFLVRDDPSSVDLLLYTSGRCGE